MEVPVISLASYFEEASAQEGGESLRPVAGSRLADLVMDIRKACEEVGFFVVVDHGVDATLMESQRRECVAFFKRPPQSLIMDMVHGSQSRFQWLDYVPAGDSAAGETWSLGPIQGRGSMPWQLDSEKMIKTWLAYYGAMESLVAVLMRLFALALCLPAETFSEALQGHQSALRGILYPAVSEADLEENNNVVVRSGKHSDWGCITVLLADEDVGGLEVEGKDGSWSQVPTVPGGLVVNLGDLLPRWTGGRWVATPHRVVARHETRHERLSIPYFGLVNRATIISPLTAPITSSDEDKDFKPISAGEFFDQHEKYVKRHRGELV